LTPLRHNHKNNGPQLGIMNDTGHFSEVFISILEELKENQNSQ
jgi:hypothetical protein